ncbi:MAG: hypothetical protein BroJett021_18720 [Chloroflexota bacterium]|jgi:hypothetical protein|nr:MAG: hypothetical protein BroJett021_18720 [Chloroflexota bacterium]
MDVTGSAAERARLIDRYGGNPLALKIVASTISGLFGDEIGAFLEYGEVIFGGVHTLLQEQFARLSLLAVSLSNRSCWSIQRRISLAQPPARSNADS